MQLSCRLTLLALAAGALAGPAESAAQQIARITPEQFREVMPEADRFGAPGGDPVVVEGYATGPGGSEALVGYLFLTSDLPPEPRGYSGPIEALVGVAVDGTLTGVRVIDYDESYMRQMGDFLRRRGNQEQYTGKYIGDPFRVNGDIDGISRVTISMRALTRGVRDGARRVASTYAAAAAVGVATEPSGRIGSWADLTLDGVVRHYDAILPTREIGVSLAYIDSNQFGQHLLGRILYERANRFIRRRGGAAHQLLLAVSEPESGLFGAEGWSFRQGGVDTPIDARDVMSLGASEDGVVAGEAAEVGVISLGEVLDLRQSFELVFAPEGGPSTHTFQYATQNVRSTATLATTPTPPVSESPGSVPPRPPEPRESRAGSELPAPDGEAVDATSAGEGQLAPPDEGSIAPDPSPTGALPAPTSGTPADDSLTSAAPAVTSPTGAPSAPAVDQRPLEGFDFAVSEDETVLQRMLDETSWSRVGIMVFVLALATWAFIAKRRSVRWASLTATLFVLGFYDGGFLSVSHITSGIWAGPGVYLRDLPLLLIVVFTVVTTLFVGRVFCGFLCPFGALQDFIDRIVPTRWQRALPRPAHERALYVKYGVLALILLPALAGSHASLYQYFEPFGTVFFRSTSVFFWSIAGAFLLASAVIPRFYCRYLCPLGAALGVTSLLTLKRIQRVEQCQYCVVCEQKCPTGAIHGAHINFKECVRCNDCEIQLIEKTGVCRHDIEAIRPRLVQVKGAPARVSNG